VDNRSKLLLQGPPQEKDVGVQAANSAGFSQPARTVNRVAGRILDEDLPAALTLHKLPPGRHTRLLEIIDRRLQVIHRELDTIPSAGPRLATGPPGATGTRCIEQQTQPVAGQPGEARCRMLVDVESQAVAVQARAGRRGSRCRRRRP
jgi:hypothetical protein